MREGIPTTRHRTKTGANRNSQSVTVLHVTDRLGGGVATSIESYLRNSPANMQHHLLAIEPDGAAISGMEMQGLKSFHRLPRSMALRPLAIRRVTKLTKADVVHAHSSFAGALVRTSLKQSRSLRLVYTPHCFAFERTDTRLAGLFALVEKVLRRNTTTLAACSRRERDLAISRLGFKEDQVAYIPNVATDRADIANPRDSGSLSENAAPLKILAVGRLAAQKDPQFFLKAVTQITALVGEVDAEWLGSGDAQLRNLLVSANIRVSAWKPHADVLRQLASSHVYFHTAAWEGFPMAVLEAAMVGVPQLVRQIPAFEHVPPSLTIDTGLTELARAWRYGEYDHWKQTNVSAWRSLLSENRASEQSKALRAVWAMES